MEFSFLDDKKKNPTFSEDDLLTSLNIINRLCINNIFHGYICQYLIQKKYIFYQWHPGGTSFLIASTDLSDLYSWNRKAIMLTSIIK